MTLLFSEIYDPSFFTVVKEISSHFSVLVMGIFLTQRIADRMTGTERKNTMRWNFRKNSISVMGTA